MEFHPATLIAKKRDGGEHSAEEISELIRGLLDGRVTDYQMSAWLMATYLNGLSDRETIALTESMLHSGKVKKTPRSGPPRIDKHSTGGVGDKISLPLVGIAAACGLSVPMIAGRGLGHTGGTLDKLEAIPGYDTRLSSRRFEEVLARVGASIIGQTGDIAPADKRIYSLRDVTATVACRPLIVASILSKKLAAGLHGLVLDVKVGRGAFMKDEKSARALAKDLVAVAKHLGTPTVARLSRMDEPLGRTIGNALEVREAIEILRGDGPPDTTEITLTLADEMLVVAGLASHVRKARPFTRRALESGEALVRFRKMVELQGGDPRVIDDPSRLPQTKKTLLVEANRSGYVKSIDALALADLALQLGAGRRHAEDEVDPAVGIELHTRAGERVEKGQPIAVLHVRRERAHYRQNARSAICITSRRSPPQEPFVGRAIR